MSGQLLLHAGAERVSLDDIIAATPPQPTETWFPIGYGDLVQTAKGSLERSGLEVVGEDYALMGEKRDGVTDPTAMFFGLLTIAGGDDFAMTVGLRSSYNQRFAASIAAGSRVFVCDNLAFSGEIRINRKQTRWAYQDLIRMVMEAMGKLGEIWTTQEDRFEAYKARDLSETEVHDLLIRAMDARVMANAYIAKVLKEWRNPTHEAFAPRTVWSLQNAFTEVFKQSNPVDLIDRTTRLHGLLDSVVEATENRGIVDGLLNGRAEFGPYVTDLNVQELLFQAPGAQYATLN